MSPGLEALLAERALAYFCTDQSAREQATGGAGARGRRGRARSPSPSTGRRSSGCGRCDGYPSDPGHADFHRKSLRGARPWAIAGAPYDPAAAAERAREQAARVRRRDRRAPARRSGRSRRARRPGRLRDRHRAARATGGGRAPSGWRRSAAAPTDAGVRMTTSADALERHAARRTAELGALHLGRGQGSAHLGFAPRRRPRLGGAAARAAPGRASVGAAAWLGGRGQRATRELLAVQASDWAFLDGRRQAGDYPFQRRDDPRGGACWRPYTQRRARAAPAKPRSRSEPRTAHRALSPMPRVLILSWEYPPLIEGGLARHVRKLSEGLVDARRRGPRAHPRRARSRRPRRSSTASTCTG